MSPAFVLQGEAKESDQLTDHQLRTRGASIAWSAWEHAAGQKPLTLSSFCPTPSQVYPKLTLFCFAHCDFRFCPIVTFVFRNVAVGHFELAFHRDLFVNSLQRSSTQMPRRPSEETRLKQVLFVSHSDPFFPICHTPILPIPHRNLFGGGAFLSLTQTHSSHMPQPILSHISHFLVFCTAKIRGEVFPALLAAAAAICPSIATGGECSIRRLGHTSPF